MISLESYPNTSYHPDFVPSHRNEIPSAFFSRVGDDGQYHILLSDREPVGFVSSWLQEGRAHFRFWFTRSCPFADQADAVALYSERVIKAHHPDRLFVHDGKRYSRALNANRFFQKGQIFQKIIETWRYQVPDAAFDNMGYIINQGLLKALPFGWFDSMAKGCGWIAAYNLLKMNHKETPMQECAESLAKRTFLGGVMGQESFMLTMWLRSKKLKVGMTLPSNRKAAAAMHASDSGILLYTHAHGAHYTTYRKLPSGEFWFYNAVYGRASHIDTAEGFMNKYVLFPFSTAIYVKKENHDQQNSKSE